VPSSDATPAVVASTRDAAGLDRPPLLILEPLAAFLDAHGLGAGAIEAEPIGDGHSNVTYLIRRGGDRWVLRRPPRPPLPPSAHDVLREFRILSACADSPVRVPAAIVACDDVAVIGAPFYLMSHVPGDVMTTHLPGGLDPEADPERIAAELVSALAEIHALDWRTTGLAEMTPPPEQYLERQVRLFTRLWQRNRTRDLPVLDRVGEWLAATRPASQEATLVHGDFRLGNTIFSPASPARLAAVLDWEMATVGDPLADVGYLSATWAMPDEAGDPILRLGTVTAEPNFPTRTEVAERYAEVTGRDISGLAWYEGLALWKSAVFLEGSYARFLDGTTDDPFFAGLETGVPELAERAWRIAQRAGAHA
jgi:aminoglycoside phosphotransferase (APT) family kinase protein